MRIVLALLLLVACSKKSSPPESKSDRSGGETVGTGGRPAPGNAGSAPDQPATETQLGSANSAILAQQARVALGEADAGVASELPADLGSGEGKGPSGKITIASKTSFDRTNLSADAVAERIMKEHFAALGNCYRSVLARDASIKGKAGLAFTVKPDGRIADAKATTADPTLQACFSQSMATWTFPVPKDADGEATEAGFQIALALLPE